SLALQISIDDAAMGDSVEHKSTRSAIEPEKDSIITSAELPQAREIAWHMPQRSSRTILLSSWAGTCAVSLIALI
ncbi:MAG: hypothetical protein ACRD1O_01745, partial [Terriglobia bacterium]